MNADAVFDVILPFDDRIMAYFRAQMSAEEEEIFFADLQANHVLRDNVVAIARLCRALKVLGPELDNQIKCALFAANQADLIKLVNLLSGKFKLAPTGSQPRYRLITLSDFEKPADAFHETGPKVDDEEDGVRQHHYGVVVAVVLLALAAVAYCLFLS